MILSDNKPDKPQVIDMTPCLFAGYEIGAEDMRKAIAKNLREEVLMVEYLPTEGTETCVRKALEQAKQWAIDVALNTCIGNKGGGLG